LGFEAADPGRYGRLVTTGDRLDKIVEFKDANAAERAITLCNSGVIMAKSSVLFDLIAAVGNDNASGEYYLTDIIGIARDQGLSATVVRCRATALADGITLSDPDTVYFAHDTVIGRDTIIEPNVVFGPGVTVESEAMIRAFSHLEGCHVSRGAIIGPYARLRPGAELAENTKVGNFVEVKNAQVAAGAKINHLSYVGDATIGEKANIGAGTVTCNYDGFFKHQTTIGAGAFIGSNTMLVAPVSVGAGAITGSGSVITQDVPDGALGLGRARQATKIGFATKLMDMLRAKKAKQIKGH